MEEKQSIEVQRKTTFGLEDKNLSFSKRKKFNRQENKQTFQANMR